MNFIVKEVVAPQTYHVYRDNAITLMDMNLLRGLDELRGKFPEIMLNTYHLDIKGTDATVDSGYLSPLVYQFKVKDTNIITLQHLGRAVKLYHPHPTNIVDYIISQDMKDISRMSFLDDGRLYLDTAWSAKPPEIIESKYTNIIFYPVIKDN